MAILLPIDPFNPARETLDRAVRGLREGLVLAYPTETLYGLGVDPFNEGALERVYRLKGRPASMPISILVQDLTMLESVVREIPPQAMRLIEAFLPGPLTLLLAARSHLPRRLTAGTGKIGVRISSHPLAAHLFRRYPAPITTTSANPTRMPGARDAQEVLTYFPDGLDCVLDAGPVPGGPGSTVVDVAGGAPTIVREGEISAQQISGALS